MTLKEMFPVDLWAIALIPVMISLIILGGVFLWLWIKYTNSSYQAASGNRFLRLIFDQGVLGEFRIYALAERLVGNRRVLTNLYIPKADGATTEIDLVILHATGIYVIESKNYGGWIFGSETSKNWTQTWKGGARFKFLNPIWQNKGHLKALQENLNGIYPHCYFSVIVFGNRAQLKKVPTPSDPNLVILNRNRLKRQVTKDFSDRLRVFSQSELEDLFHRLSQFTLADQDTRDRHILSIKKTLATHN